MEVSQVALAKMCIWSFLAGCAGGAVYDGVLLIRFLLGESPQRRTERADGERIWVRIVRFLTDFLFALACGICVILIRYFLNDGKPRLGIPLLFIAGVLLWRAGPARLTRPLLVAVSGICKKIMAGLWHILLQPLRFFIQRRKKEVKNKDEKRERKRKRTKRAERGTV